MTSNYAIIGGNQPSSLAGGDLSGTFPNPIVTAIDGYSIASPPPAINYPTILEYVGTGTNLTWSGPYYAELNCANSASTVTLTNKNQWYFINIWQNAISYGLTANASDGYFTFTQSGIYYSQIHVSFSAQTGTQLLFSSVRNGTIDGYNQCGATVYGGITGTPQDNISFNHIDIHTAGDTVGLAVMQTSSVSPIVLGIVNAHWDKFLLR